MEVRRDPRSLVFFIILLFLLNSPEPHSPQPFNGHSPYDDVLERERNQLGVLNRTQYGDFDPANNKWVNITGLREEDKLAWDLLAPVTKKVREQAGRVVGDGSGGLLDGDAEDVRVPLYKNITGYVQGEWARSSLGRVRHPADMHKNATNGTRLAYYHYQTVEYDRNLTGSGGPVRLRLSELEDRMRTDENRTVSEVSARIVIGDDDSYGRNWWEFAMHGVHYPELGGAVLTTTSDKFAGIFALPHFQTSKNLFAKSQQLLRWTINETIEKQENRYYPLWNPWSSVVEGNEMMMGTPHCEFVLFLQQHPVQVQSRTKQPAGIDMDWLEEELRYPTGALMPRRTPLTMSMIGFSPDCGFVIESKGPPDLPPSEYIHLVGSKAEDFNDRARKGILAFVVTLFTQLLLIIRQMKDTATPSTRNRVSFYTIAMLAVGDGFYFLALVFMHLFLGTSHLPLFATAFLALVSIVLALRFLLDIWTVQVTERMRQEREQLSSTPQPPSQSNTAPSNRTTPPPPTQAGGLPLPATAARPATPIIVAPDQNDRDEDATTPQAGGTTDTTTPGRAELGALYTRYCFLLIVVFFLTLQFISVRSTVRGFYFNTLCFLYLSFWCPQIYRNIMRNCRKALRWDFVFGQSATRLLPIVYFYAVPTNVLFSSTDLKALAVLAGWVWVQILALGSQEILGPRFFVREGWAPPAYDYHPILRVDEEGATMPVGSSLSQFPEEEDSSSMSKAGESKRKGKKLFDCSICATDVEVPAIASGSVGESGSSGAAGMILQRRAYMVTPCRHIFHTPCLEGWMRYRLQCPNCREVLPPL